MNREPQSSRALFYPQLVRSLRYPLTLLLLIIAGLLIFGPPTIQAQEETTTTQPAISGRVVDNQGQPIVEAEINAFAPGRETPLAHTASLENGTWGFVLPFIPQDELEIVVERAHFAEERIILNAGDLAQLATTGTLRTGEMVLSRVLTPAFWAATLIFIAVLLLIAFERLHSTSAALLGISLIFIVSFIGGTFFPGLFIYTFERALTYINWEVIFLVMAMMIIIAIIEGTGVFQWTAFAAYRMSRGRSWVLVLILMAITAVASALLDNFTTMLLMTPISLQIGLAIGINPLALIIPEVLASNVGGISTLIGTPTNILIGAYADIGFNGFLVNQTPGVILALVAMGGYVLWHYRKEWRKSTGGISPRLYERLEENARIRQPDALRKSSVVFVLVIIGFILGEQIHVPPAVPALIGATALLIWLKPDVHAMIKAVDWTTLVFFMALFMIVGAIQEVGLISLIASQIGAFVGDNLALAIFVIVFGVGTLSIVIANIPLAASMLPVVEFLSGTIPGANSKVLYYALSMGAAMGGNGTIVGAEANLVTAGITQQAGTPISFAEFLKVGIPVTYITLTIGFLWLYFWFILF